MRWLEEYFRGKTILVTGNTGFKGSWLTAWLLQLGAEVVGLSDGIPTEPSHFVAASLVSRVHQHTADLRDPGAVELVIRQAEPDFLFHLAAQALVRRAYGDPILTFHTNTLGTAHVLEALRKLNKPCVAVLITSDKCYDNVEWVWGYRETDALGGSDPYSASKAAAEMVIRSYLHSYFPKGGSVRIGVGRAGNVIGGGDWASDRIVPDCVRAWSEGETVELRSPLATRPWQHVLEPLSGYLALAAELTTRAELHGEPLNFGPPSQQNHTVLELVECMSRHWEQVRWRDVSCDKGGPYESGLLKLNCDKALQMLRWQAVLDFEQTVRLTAEWYRHYYQQPDRCILEFTLAQIADYTAGASRKGLAWAQQC